MTTHTVTIIVFLAARQNSPSIQEFMYASNVNRPPVSMRVLTPLTAYHQSALEKKSNFTLNDPQNVHKNGKIEITNQQNIKIENTEKTKKNSNLDTENKEVT